jgi:hypothetical protein
MPAVYLQAGNAPKRSRKPADCEALPTNCRHRRCRGRPLVQGLSSEANDLRQPPTTNRAMILPLTLFRESKGQRDVGQRSTQRVRALRKADTGLPILCACRNSHSKFDFPCGSWCDLQRLSQSVSSRHSLAPVELSARLLVGGPNFVGLAVLRC